MKTELTEDLKTSETLIEEKDKAPYDESELAKLNKENEELENQITTQIQEVATLWNENREAQEKNTALRIQYELRSNIWIVNDNIEKDHKLFTDELAAARDNQDQLQK